jgi:hypothetical protein
MYIYIQTYIYIYVYIGNRVESQTAVSVKVPRRKEGDKAIVRWGGNRDQKSTRIRGIEKIVKKIK